MKEKKDGKKFLTDEQLQGSFLRHEPCPECGSSNNVAVWLNELTGKETKYCNTPGCSYKITSASLFRSSQPGEALPLSWCIKKGLTEDIARRYRITHDGKVVYFGIADSSGKLCGVSGRNYAYPKQDDRHFFWKTPTERLYGMDTCRGTDKLIITTGFWDAPSAHLLTGLPAISLINGDKGVKNDIQNNYQWLRQFKVIYTICDNDESGQYAAQTIAELLGYRVKNVVLPDLQVILEDGVKFCKDSSDFLVYGLRDAYRAAIDAADTATTAFLWGTEADDLYADYKQNGSGTGWSTGIGALDQKVTLRRNEFTVLFGAPGRGKSSLARYFLHAISTQGVKVYYFSFEDPVHVAIDNLATLFGISDSDPRRVSRVVREQVSISNVTAPSPDELAETIECAYMTYGCQFFVLDHITWLINKSSDERKAAVRYIDVIATAVKQFPIHVLVISHNKPANEQFVQKQSGKNLREDWEEWLAPTQRDCQWSSAFEQVAWNMWGWKKPNDIDEPGRLYVLKNRVGGFKGLGIVMLKYDEHTRKFMGIEDYNNAKRKGTTHRDRRNTDILLLDSGEAITGEVQPSDSAVREGDSPVPTSTEALDATYHTIESGILEREEPHSNRANGRNADVHAEVHESRLATGLLHSGFRLNTGVQRQDAQQFPRIGGNLYASASRVVQKVQDSLSEAKPVHTAPQKVDLRKVGGIIRNPLDVLQSFSQSKSGGNSRELVQPVTIDGISGKWGALLK